jgi:NAD(P)-dependent dehydrogenase (short-subunit alcohol dehydrogenase family)
MVVPTDVRDDEAVEACLGEVVAHHGLVDVVVHCAGVVAYGRTEEVPAAVFDGVIAANVTGSVNVARHTISQLRRQGEGSLVLFGSVIGHIAVPSMSAYVLSKWSVRALARQLQIENRDMHGVTIAYIAPGGVDTPIYEQAANYSGFAGRPPPPVESPERVARITMRRLDRHRARTQTGLANDFMRFGFNVTPWLFDILVGPLYNLAATDRTRPVVATAGNVLHSLSAGYGLHGDQGSAVIGMGRNVVARLTSLVRSTQ